MIYYSFFFFLNAKEKNKFWINLIIEQQLDPKIKVTSPPSYINRVQYKLFSQVTCRINVHAFLSSAN